MNSNLIVIHTHFHKRRTGVTRSIENILPELKRLCTTYLYGYGIEGEKITVSQLKKLLFSKENIVVHCHRNNEILKMLRYRTLGAKFKLVATRHAETEPSGFTKFLLKKSDEVVTLTNSMHKSLGISNVKVPHGVDTNLFIPNPEKKLSNIAQKNIILCAGRVRKAKGQIVLLEAVAPELQKNKDWALVVVGKVDKPPFLEELKAIAKKNKVENQVYFIDETLDIVSYYQAAKISVVPSFTEGFSLVCAEAMACGNTVVATKNVGVHSELIANLKSGYLFTSGNTAELQEIITNLINDKLPSLGSSARKEIEENWSARKEAEGLVEVYKEINKKP
ncbi:glycosyltransferase family 4 protein [Tenacibaculum larymnensis]|uniref:Glycosyltransferase family 4 protein n=1 Tax=Tenacibaculum larymnensis TaxID=2878201 RepID=A0A9X4EPC7_9FLAO|nr:glycosyltransferase family 4 protein [Tenacibaculum larymnensis]MDE1205710.1 glycosyltransferase family 4 protein [Tenacibaculum larymnensis]